MNKPGLDEDVVSRAAAVGRNHLKADYVAAIARTALRAWADPELPGCLEIGKVSPAVGATDAQPWISISRPAIPWKLKRQANLIHITWLSEDTPCFLLWTTME